MAAIDSLHHVPFASDMPQNNSWDAHVPYPSMAMHDTGTMMDDDLDIYATEADITTPITSTDNISAALGAPEAASDPTVMLRKRPASLIEMPTTFANYKKPKLEQAFATEPVTPHSTRSPSSTSLSTCSSVPYATGAQQHHAHADCRSMLAGMPVPLSPNPSACTEEPFDDDHDFRSLSSTPAPATTFNAAVAGSGGMEACAADATDSPTTLVVPTREQAARRRALRRIALNKARAKKEEGVGVGMNASCHSRSDGVKGEVAVMNASNSKHGSSGNCSEPVDKKAARAIRNREAAMKSRIEAKLKMRKLQDENNSLAVKVRSLSQENEELTAQLKSLLQHTLRVSVSEGQDVKQVLDLWMQTRT